MSDASKTKSNDKWVRIPSVPSTNYVLVSRRDSAVEGAYALDLSLPAPPLHRNISDEDRKNLALHTTGGPITAEVWIIAHGHTHNVNGRAKSSSTRVTMRLCSDNGFVDATLHDPSSPDGDEDRLARPSLDVDVCASHGDVSLSIPRCFRGPITIPTTHDRIALSPALERCTALISDVRGVRVYFVGERPRLGDWGRGCEGEGEGEEDGEVTGNIQEEPEPVDSLFVGGEHTKVRISRIGEEQQRWRRRLIRTGIGKHWKATVTASGACSLALALLLIVV
ncbi:hypothetical protein F5148DRAFT_344328 [Russula earlei]|uniref:Uncharacterized protein n=1 Tax=Russula earlei TaxID=71964 RepID=A0ACC0UK07_9AGAM|nr:hypothetical protein F5148DRAFT_344328 [Russula earlei]